MIDAARKAHAHRFIEDLLEHGYETNVGQLGGRLSGGQRQRISLARAILRDPPILILDEATSQIDIESEQLIHKALEHFTRDRTAVIITHRLSTLDLADRILVLEAGRVVDLGHPQRTHRTLRALSAVVSDQPARKCVSRRVSLNRRSRVSERHVCFRIAVSKAKTTKTAVNLTSQPLGG